MTTDQLVSEVSSQPDARTVKFLGFRCPLQWPILMPPKGGGAFRDGWVYDKERPRDGASMTYTFKLARRLARFRAVLLLPAAVLFTSCAAEQASGPEITEEPASIEITPGSTEVGVDGTVQFEAAAPGDTAVARYGRERWWRSRPTDVDITPQSTTLRPGASHRFEAYARTASGAKVYTSYRWSATGGRVDDAGRYTAGKTPGKFIVVASTWSGVSDTAEVTITGSTPGPVPDPVTQVVLSPATTSVAVRGNAQFTAVGMTSGGTEKPITAVFSASNGTVSSSGRYTAPGTPGTYRVIATDQTSGKADTSSVEVTQSAPVVDRVVLTPSSANVDAGESRQFTAVGRTADGDNVSITATFTAAGGTISSSGEYDAGQQAGTYRVIATHQPTGEADTSWVTVEAPEPPAPTVASVTVTPSDVDLTVGQTRQLSAVVRDGDGDSMQGQSVSWQSSNTSIARVSSSGMVTAVAAGSAEITASSGGKSDESDIAVTNANPDPEPDPDPNPDPPPPPPTGGSVAGCPSSGYSRLVNVSGSSQLSSALSNAQAGDQIQLAAGNYSGNYNVSRSGFTLCGPRSAVLTGDLRLSNVSDVTVQGFSLRGGFQAIFAKNVDRSRFQGLEISNIGQEAIHLLCGSSDNVVRENYIHDTGTGTARWGEGVYVGTDPSNRSMHCGGSTDATERTHLIGNRIGPNVRGEDIDVKPGADGTIIENNVSDGSGKDYIAGYAESFFVVRADDVTVKNNRASNAPRHGYWNHSGSRVTYHGNQIDLGGAGGYGFRSDGGSGHVVGCDNTVTGGSFANVSCR